MSNCIFCRIANGEISTELLYEDDKVVAFKDLNPQAPIHILIIPKEHSDSVKEMNDEVSIGRLFTAAKKVAEKLDTEHYRLVINTGIGAGQSVFHTHLHLLGGRLMSWPPG
ncbi:MAG: histidine triad nucleotide-binding protein [Candidatus Aminicenantes bacterium]|nr:histidine triad nucleotide-binding protein [Candidatus Aminicenantes bacterium]